MSPNQDMDLENQIDAKRRELTQAQRELEAINSRIEQLRKDYEAGGEDYDPSDAAVEGGRKRLMEESIKDLEGEIRRLETQRGGSGALASEKEHTMSGHGQYRGTVRGGKFYLSSPEQTAEQAVRLTSMSMAAAMKPESKELDLSDYEGRSIVVEGYYSGDWIYSAAVIDEGSSSETNA